jgi:SpoVK/Ycf46/Vps4 family AAA+-type ATPase
MIFKKNKSDKNYKLKSFQVYAWDRAMGGIRKFRRLFERSELNYLSVELSIYNKLFDEDDWETEIEVYANELLPDGKTNRKCEKTEKVTISKEDNIFKYSFGWGSDERGSFWKQGTYQWEIYLDGEFVDSAKFYVEDVGNLNDGSNPYMYALSLNTYEAPDGDLDPDDREYLKTFNVKTTRYVMGEFRFTNMVDHDWNCELFFHIYDDTGTHVGTSDILVKVVPDESDNDEFTVTAGWGANDPGTWIEDSYTMEVVFMDKVMAVIPFSISDKEQKRLTKYEALVNEEVDSVFGDVVEVKKSNEEIEESTSEEKSETTVEPEGEEEKVEVFIDDRSVDEILNELDSLVGLDNIKTKVREYIDYVSFLQFREESGIEEDEKVVLHSVFTGNPGTGKTTVVKLLGGIFKSMGLLSKGHVHSVEANDLISGYIRQSGKDTKKAIEKARGGILFIDEAYMLFREGATNDFGPEAIAALITEMSDGKGDIAIMVAGYPKEMDEFIGSNPGLKSRFRNHFHFNDYTPRELVEISKLAAKKKGVKLSKPAEGRLRKIVTDAYRKRDRTFGNARFAVSLIDEAKINLGLRIMKDPNLEELDKKVLSTIEPDDIEDINTSSVAKKLSLPIDNDLLQEALSELNELTGLENIKQEVNELIKLSKYYKEINRDILKAFSMHSVFKGNPGTGKTTVARVMAKIYKALGMLERGHLIDADGSDLEAGYLGQTALKTKELIKQAMGGILFIDEAYSITEGRNTDFGKKAVAALIKEMEDKRSQFGLIVAGYTENMDEFLESNPGLKSRFDQTFEFEDFTEDELWKITIGMFGSRDIVPDEEASNHLKEYIKHLYVNRDKFFGNARSVRKLIEKAVRNHELRMADLAKDKRTQNIISTLTLDDVKEFVPNKSKSVQRRPLGFKLG